MENKKNLPCEKRELFALLISPRRLLFIPLRSLVVIPVLHIVAWSLS
jgi:hypothetical protein